MNQEVRIGLETHVELDTEQKLFCNCYNRKSKQINEYTCPICTGQPGSMPSINYEAITKAVNFATITGARINPRIIFSRKHYYYRDLPKSYQLTQDDEDAVGYGGRIELFDLKTKEFSGESVELDRIILEENPGAQLKKSIDFNRSGSPLLEIVTKPVFKNSEQVINYLTNLRFILCTLNFCKAEGNFKSDVNVSVGQNQRVELKNIGSIANIELAIDAEVKRQKMTKVDKTQCRSYDKVFKTTVWSRNKELHRDYCFLREPDIPEIEVSGDSTEVKLEFRLDNSQFTPFLIVRPAEFTKGFYEELKNLYQLNSKMSREISFAVILHPFVKAILTQCVDSITPKIVLSLIQELKFHKIKPTIEVKNELVKLINLKLETSQTISKIRQILSGRIMSYNQHQIISSLRSLFIGELSDLVKEYRQSRSQKIMNQLVGMVKMKVKGCSYEIIVRELNG